MNKSDFEITAGNGYTYYFFMDEMKVKISTEEEWNIKIDNGILLWLDISNKIWTESPLFNEAYRKYFSEQAEKVLLESYE